ncbi:MAG: hypothetical protein U0X20_05715 [Caldilineaceae bacterium]
MTYSVWWYVLAGFLLGFILSTLWEWLYFRRRRMQIENQRIVELEATVRSLSTVSQSAEANTSSGFAAGYQSPMVFLEGEEDDVDTVEVIVPASPEPIDFDQPVVEQQRAGNQFVTARAASTGRTSTSNGNGLVREATGETPIVEPAAVAASRAETTQSTLPAVAFAAGAAAATALTRDKEQPAGAPYLAEQSTTEPPAAETPAGEAPAAEAAVGEMPAARTIVYGVPAEQAAEENMVQEQSPEEHMSGLVGDLAPSRQITSVSAAPSEVEPPLALPQPAEQPEVQSAPPDQRAGSLAPAAAALAGAKVLDDRQTKSQQQPEDVADHTDGSAVSQTTATSTVEAQPTTSGAEGATAGAAGQPAADASTQLTTEPTVRSGEAQPVITQTAPPQAAPGQPDSQRQEEDPGLTPAGVAVLASALASTLAGDQHHPPEGSQQQAPQPPASPAEPPAAVPQVEAPGSQTALESAPAARALPIPDTQPSTAADIQDEQQDAEDAGTGVNPGESAAPAERTGPDATADKTQQAGMAADADTGSAPAEAKPVGQAAGSALDSGKPPLAVTSQEQEPALPLSAILPRATKPAPLSKSGQTRRPDAAPASAVAASGIEPDIEQVSNQLDDLIDSINGLLERTQPLLEQPASQVVPAEAPFTPTSPTALDDYSAGDDSGVEESADTGVTGPYSAQNLSRMEYGLVQLMQAVRRLGRDVRSAF